MLCSYRSFSPDGSRSFWMAAMLTFSTWWTQHVSLDGSNMVSKTEQKKIERKQKRCQHLVANDSGIRCSDEPTPVSVCWLEVGWPIIIVLQFCHFVEYRSVQCGFGQWPTAGGTSGRVVQTWQRWGYCYAEGQIVLLRKMFGSHPRRADIQCGAWEFAAGAKQRSSLSIVL